MQNDEILIVQNYLRETFSNDEIQIRKSDSDINLCNIFISNISVGNILRDEDPDDDEIDVTLILDGWHGDSSRMYCSGDPSVKAKNLINNTYESMMKGIELIRPGIKLGDLGSIIQENAEKNNYSVVREFCGHGIGEVFHDEPNILRVSDAGSFGVKNFINSSYTYTHCVN